MIARVTATASSDAAPSRYRALFGLIWAAAAARNKVRRRPASALCRQHELETCVVRTHPYWAFDWRPRRLQASTPHDSAVDKRAQLLMFDLRAQVMRLPRSECR